MKLYVLTMGKALFCVSHSIEDAEYEKSEMENDNIQGRKLGIKISEINIPKDWEDKGDNKVRLSNNVEYTYDDIMQLA